jgi:hypothetical protein
MYEKASTGRLFLNMVKQKYELTVWFLFVVGDECEKDFEIHEVEAETLAQAIEKVRAMYRQGVLSIWFNDEKVYK